MNWAVVREPTVLMTAAVYGLLEYVVVRAGIFGLWLGILLFCSIWRYCYAVLRAVAQGHSRIPPPDLDSFNLVGDWAVFWHFVFFPGIVVATLPYQPIGLFVALAAACCFPASVAIMGLNSNLAQALNPPALLAFARTLGTDYAWLVGGTVAIVGGVYVIVSYVVPVFGAWSLLASLVIETWALLATFALVGSSLRAHRTHFEIAGEVRPREDEALRVRDAEWRKDLDIAYASFRSGIDSSGYKTLRALVQANGDSVEINHWLVENMLDWEQKRYAFEVVAKLMPRLLARGEAEEALELYRRCRRRDPSFRPPREQAEQLAAHAAAIGQTGLANELSYNWESD
jgi:hypothetical protein